MFFFLLKKNFTIFHINFIIRYFHSLFWLPESMSMIHIFSTASINTLTDAHWREGEVNLQLTPQPLSPHSLLLVDWRKSIFCTALVAPTCVQFQKISLVYVFVASPPPPHPLYLSLYKVNGHVDVVCWTITIQLSQAISNWNTYVKFKANKKMVDTLCYSKWSMSLIAYFFQICAKWNKIIQIL